MANPDRSNDEAVSSRSLKVRHFVLIAVIAIAVVAFLYYMTEVRKPGETSPPPAGVSVVPEGSRAVTLFFADVQGEGLVTETREVAIGPDYADQLVQVVKALLAGPEQSGVNAIPSGTKLLDAFYDSETATAYLDFSSELVANHPGGSSAEYYTIAALMRTVSENIPEVEAVQILVEGLQVGTIGGHIDAYQPFRVSDWR